MPSEKIKKVRIVYEINGLNSGYLVQSHDDVWDEWWDETKIVGDKNNELVLSLVEAAKKYFENMGCEVDVGGVI